MQRRDDCFSVFIGIIVAFMRALVTKFPDARHKPNKASVSRTYKGHSELNSKRNNPIKISKGT